MQYPVAGWGLIPLDLQASILGGLVLIAAAQWVLLFPLARQKNVLSHFDSIKGERIQNAKEKRPFFEDIWFILWNLFPFALGYFCFYLMHQWSSWILAIDAVLVPNTLEKTVHINAFWNQKWMTVLALALCGLAVFSQFKKQKSFEDDPENSIVYWWDRRISKRIFNIRAIALFFNMFVFLSGLLNVVKAYHLTLSLSEMDVQPIWTHPDGMAGFSALGELGLSATMVVVLVSGCGLVALIDHKGKQGVLHLISDLALICLSIPALWLLSMPLTRLFDSIMIEHNQVVKLIGPSIQTQIESLKVQAEGATVEELSLLTAVLERPRYPIDLEMLIQLVSSFLLPVLVYSNGMLRRFILPNEPLEIDWSPIVIDSMNKKSD